MHELMRLMAECGIALSYFPSHSDGLPCLFPLSLVITITHHDSWARDKSRYKRVKVSNLPGERIL